MLYFIKPYLCHKCEYIFADIKYEVFYTNFR